MLIPDSLIKQKKRADQARAERARERQERQGRSREPVVLTVGDPDALSHLSGGMTRTDDDDDLHSDELLTGGFPVA